MMNLIWKRMNNKKGFTLIELIVVIAILGILAIIAIPRFAGFTDKAKIQADEQYAALVGNAAVVLLADGTFTSGGTIDIPDTGSVDSTDITGWDVDEMEKLVKAIDLQYYDGMTVTITADGTHSVTALDTP